MVWSILRARHPAAWSQVAITTNKASGGDGILAELFKILKDDAVKLLHSTCQKIWKTQQWPQDWKRSVFIPIPKTGNAKECSNYHATVLISHASKVMLKILPARLQQYVNWELSDGHAGFRKGKGTRDQIVNIHWIIEIAKEFQRNIYFCLIDCAKAFVWITANCRKFLKRWGYIYMEFREIVMITLYERQQKRHRCIEQSFGLFLERERVRWFWRMALKHV